MYKDKDQLELQAQSEEDMEGWKAALLRAGVYPTREQAVSVSIEGQEERGGGLTCLCHSRMRVMGT